jgi:hypothetical protein
LFSGAPNEGMRHSGAVTRVKWGQEVNADEFEEVSLVNPQHHQMGGAHQQINYTQDALLNRRAKSGGGRFAGMNDVLNLNSILLRLNYKNSF